MRPGEPALSLTLLVVVGLGAAVGSCASTATGDELVLASPQAGAATTVRVTPGRAFGPQLDVARGAAGFRGRFADEPVEVSLERQDQAVGLLGGRPVDLTVRPVDGAATPGAFTVKGLAGGERVDLTLAGGRLRGHAGRCEYDLAAADGVTFRGDYSCGGRPHPRARLVVPPALFARSLAEGAALLTLVLTRTPGVPRAP